MSGVAKFDLMEEGEGNLPAGLRERRVCEDLDESGLIYLVRSRRDLRRAATALKFFAPRAEVAIFPHWDCLPYDRTSPSPEVASARASALSRLADHDGGAIVVATLPAVLQRLPPRAAFHDAGLKLEPGLRLTREPLVEWLESNGYAWVDVVVHPGEFSCTAELLEVIPAGAQKILRLSLWDGTLHAIEALDRGAEASATEVTSSTLPPGSEVLLQKANADTFIRSWIRNFGEEASEDEVVRAIRAGRRADGLEHWLPLFYDHTETLFDYLPNAHVAMEVQAEDARDWLDQVREIWSDRVSGPAAADAEDGSPYRTLAPEQLWISEPEFAELLGDRRCVRLPSPDAKPRPFDSESVAGWVQNAGRRVPLAVAENAAALRQFARWFRENDIETRRVSDWEEAQAHRDRGVLLAHIDLETGFQTDDLTVITRREVLGTLPPRPASIRKLRFSLPGMCLGEPVVHLDYGIGCLEELQVVEAEGAIHETFRVSYRDGDNVFVPCDRAELLWRYAVHSEKPPRLDALRSTAWQKRREEVRASLDELARKLVTEESARARTKVPAIEPPPDFERFVSRFPYEETPDQSEAADAVRRDLASGRPMDRLIIGDVGFGKTEVMLRAAFAVSRAGYQVAIVVPTTPLARQHCETFRARMAGFGVKIAQYSRTRPDAELRQIRRDLRAGSIDVIIGTQGVLSLKFERLGLVVLDEEHRLGVRQKEQLRRDGRHRLAFSATPIPRTLEFALSGLRDVSVIASAPLGRQPVLTYAEPWDSVVVKQALLREARRGGRSFVVCARLADLETVKACLEELVPSLTIVSAHGRLSGAALDRAVTRFVEGQSDILLSTNIIEAGLDIPSANTLIVHRANLFGLAQLHQLRGRIGRGGRQGYAYLTWSSDRKPTRAARRRMEILASLDEPGSGSLVAMMDRDMRGAGALVGEDQAGHAKQVGAELFQHMLAAAAHRALNDVGPAVLSPKIELGLSPRVPEPYVQGRDERVALYRRIAAPDADLDAMTDELETVFGPLPPEAQALLAAARAKQLCRRLGIEAVEGGPKGVAVSFGRIPPWAERVAAGPDLEVLSDGRILRRGNFEEPATRMRAAEALLAELVRIGDSQHC